MNEMELIKVAQRMTDNYMQKPELGADEQLQLLACAYSTLFLYATQNNLRAMADSHNRIAEALGKIGQADLAIRHKTVALAYQTQLS